MKLFFFLLTSDCTAAMLKREIPIGVINVRETIGSRVLPSMNLNFPRWPVYMDFGSKVLKSTESHEGFKNLSSAPPPGSQIEKTKF